MRSAKTLVLLSGLVVSVHGSAAHAMEPVTDLGLLPGDAAVLPAVSSQYEPVIAPGGAQFLVVWSDQRGRRAGSQSVQSDGDLFGIRLDSAGLPIEAAPFLIAGGMGLQDRPRVAWNGQAWLVVYQSQDPTPGYFDTFIRAQRVSATGQVLDAVPLSLPQEAFSPSTIGLTVSGQSGEWLLARCVYHADGYGTFVGGQRISGQGALLDASPVMLSDWVYGQVQLLPSGGSYLVVGPDWNNSDALKARRVSASLQPQGAVFNLPADTRSIAAALGGAGGEFYVTWVPDFVNLVGSRMTWTGTLSTPAGTPLMPAFGYAFTMTHDGTNWWLLRTGGSEARTMRISSTGAVLDPGGVPLPIVVTGTVSALYSPALTPRAEGGALMLWNDSRAALGNDSNVFTLPLSPTNQPSTERCVSLATTGQRSVEIAGGPAGTSAVVFVSEAANDARVLVHRLDASGTPLTPEPIEIFRGPTVGRAGIAWSGSVYAVAFDSGASGLSPTQIKMRRFSPDGTFLDPQPVSVMTGFSPAVGVLGDRFLVVGANFGSTAQIINLLARRYDGATGAAQDAGPVYLAGGYVSGLARVRSDGVNWLVAAHSQWTHNSSQGDAILVTVPPIGSPKPAINPTPLAGGTGDLDIAFSGSGYLLAWRNNSLSSANNFIAGRLMNIDGTFPGAMFTIAEAPGRQLRPVVSWDGSTYVVAWEDQRSQTAFYDARTDIFAQRVDVSGALIGSAFPIVATPDGDAGVALLSRGGSTLAAATRFVTTPPWDSYRIGLSRFGAPAACNPADITGIGGSPAAPGNPDGQLTVDDVIVFVGLFGDSTGCPGAPGAPCNRADITDIGHTGAGPDGQLTVDDIIAFVNAFGDGC